MTTAVTEQRLTRIREIVAEHLEIDPAELTDDSNFIDDHDADSLGLIDVLAALEKEFRIEIGQTQFARMLDVRSVYEVIAESTGW